MVWVLCIDITDPFMHKPVNALAMVSDVISILSNIVIALQLFVRGNSTHLTRDLKTLEKHLDASYHTICAAGTHHPYSLPHLTSPQQLHNSTTTQQPTQHFRTKRRIDKRVGLLPQILDGGDYC